MQLKTNRSGFTLLEIIIVIIIIGVLASLALPRLFSTIEFSRSTEALNALGTMRRAADHCAMMGGSAMDYSTCVDFANLAVEDPGASNGANFCYTIGYASPVLTLTAIRNGANNGDGAGSYTDIPGCVAGGGSTIVMTLNDTTGAVTKAGSGAFDSIK